MLGTARIWFSYGPELTAIVGFDSTLVDWPALCRLRLESAHTRFSGLLDLIARFAWSQCFCHFML